MMKTCRKLDYITPSSETIELNLHSSILNVSDRDNYDPDSYNPLAG